VNTAPVVATSVLAVVPPVLDGGSGVAGSERTPTVAVEQSATTTVRAEVVPPPPPPGAGD